jgi:hypothetical protein
MPSALRVCVGFVFTIIFLLSITETIVLPSIWFFLSLHVRSFIE